MKNINDKDIITTIENLADEYSWIYNQGNGLKEYNIAKTSFIDGAKLLMDILKEKWKQNI